MNRKRKAKSTLTPGLNKSETISVRLSPKHRYAVELLARSDRIGVSAVIEALIRERFRSTFGPPQDMPPAERQAAKLAHALRQGVSDAESLLQRTWDPRPSDRFVSIALLAPWLMTEEEELQWKLIKEAPTFWKGSEPRRDLIRTHWEAILRAAQKGSTSLSHLTVKE